MISFRYPLIFFLYSIFALMILYHWVTRKRRIAEIEQWGDNKVRERLFTRVNSNTSRWKNRLRWWALALLIFSATGPQIGTKLTEVKRKGVDIIIALDVSNSMKAEDVKPSRLEKSKFEISRFVSRLKGDRIGLIVFAGTSHLYLPLTGDYDAVRLFVEAIDTEMIQTQGTALANALTTAFSSFTEEDEKYRVLIVVTDGEDHEGEALEVARQAVKTGIVIHAAGVGTSSGSLIPIQDEKGNRVDYKKDRKGKLVTSILNEPMLRELVMIGGGVFTRFNNRSGSMDDILNMINTMEKKTLKTHEYSQFEDRYQVFVAFALFLLAGDIFISNRRSESGVWRGRFV